VTQIVLGVLLIGFGVLVGFVVDGLHDAFSGSSVGKACRQIAAARMTAVRACAAGDAGRVDVASVDAERMGVPADRSGAADGRACAAGDAGRVGVASVDAERMGVPADRGGADDGRACVRARLAMLVA
jgi:hypothetical protein